MATGFWYFHTLTFPAPAGEPMYQDTDDLTPFLYRTVNAADAVHTKTIIADDDDQYDMLFWTEEIPANYRTDEFTQSLAVDTVLGGKLFKAGHFIHLGPGGMFEQLSPTGGKTGNMFRIIYPFEKGGDEPRYPEHDVLGDASTVFIIPEPRSDGQGGQILPEFDPVGRYVYRGKASVYSADPRITYRHESPAPACFTTGTLIACPDGPRAIETLQPGDLVMTRDHGPQPIRWIGSRRLDANDLDLNPAFRPIRIRAGALGDCLPAADLVVSPQHRVLVQSALTHKLSGEWQVLIAAKHLTDTDGIDVIGDADDVTYWHILFQDHELVQSNGAWTESLFAGPQAVQSVDRAGRREIARLFPELGKADGTGPAPARPFVAGREGRKIARHHARKNAALIAG